MFLSLIPHLPRYADELLLRAKIRLYFDSQSFACWYVAEPVWTKLCPVQFYNRIAEGCKGAADLAIATFMHSDEPFWALSSAFSSCSLLGPSSNWTP